MNDLPLAPLFAVGLLGAGHCAGMCGGIVAALAGQGRRRSAWVLNLAYNLGRICSYAVAGALAGGLGQSVFGKDLTLRLALLVAANLMLLAMGAYLMGRTQALAWVERGGQRLWRRIQPLTGRFLPVRGPAQAFPLGMLWGWLPCGLVYSALVTALGAGAAAQGAAVMVAFGLGTLPTLLMAGLLLARYRTVVQQPWVRRGAGLVVMAFGFHGLWGASRLLAALG